MLNKLKISHHARIRQLTVGLLIKKRQVNSRRDKVSHPDGIKYKHYFYRWNRLRSYAIREEEDEGGSFNYLVLNLKNAKVPLEIQLDWINNQKSVAENMAIFAKAFQIEFEGALKKK